MPTEEVARQLVLGGHLKEEPTTPLVAEALRGLEVEEQTSRQTRSCRRRAILPEPRTDQYLGKGALNAGPMTLTGAPPHRTADGNRRMATER
jgi:hypothetical protein